MLERRTRPGNGSGRSVPLLDSQLGYAYTARFESDAGLIPASPPKELSDIYRDKWKHHQMRLQRLHQIIEELSTQ
jgi:hypothetical protein